MAARPNRSGQQLVSQGLAAHTLATTHTARLTPRLAAGLVDGLGADLATLGEAVPGALTARQAKKGATALVATSAADVARRVASVRLAITHAGLNAGSKKAWGVGQPVNPRVVKSVVAASDLIGRRAAAAPEEARAAGLLAADLIALAAAAAELSGSDRTQEGAKLSAKDATAARNAAGRRVEEATKRVATAGQLEFGEQPAIASEFAALLSAGTKKRAPKPVPG